MLDMTEPQQQSSAASEGDISERLRKEAFEAVDWNGETMKQWDKIRALCAERDGSDLPRLMFESLIDSLSELMIDGANEIDRLRQVMRAPAQAVGVPAWESLTAIIRPMIESVCSDGNSNSALLAKDIANAILAAQPPAAPVETDEYAGAHEIYCNASRKLPVGCEACSCRAGREIKKLRALQCSSAGNVDACRAHVAETALREVRRYCETVDLSRSETLIALVKRTVDAALALSSDLPQAAAVTVDPDGINGCMVVAARALDYLADHDRPIGGQSRYNAEHLIQLASELRRTSGALSLSRPLLCAHGVKIGNTCVGCMGAATLASQLSGGKND